MDPIYTYKNTKRKINISFDVPNQNLLESKRNYEYINIFLDSLYPIMQLGDMTGYAPENLYMVGSSNVRGSPLFRINFLNYISNNEGMGLLGIIQDLSFKPELDSGFFIEEVNNETLIYPKLFKISFIFDVLHETNQENKFSKSIYDSSDVGKYKNLGEFRETTVQITNTSKTAQQEEDDLVDGFEPSPDDKEAETPAKESEKDKSSAETVPGKETEKDGKAAKKGKKTDDKKGKGKNKKDDKKDDKKGSKKTEDTGKGKKTEEKGKVKKGEEAKVDRTRRR